MQAFFTGRSATGQAAAEPSASAHVVQEPAAALQASLSPTETPGAATEQADMAATVARESQEFMRRVDIAAPPVADERVTAADASKPSERLEDALVRIVSEKTGYPPEMLDLDLDMEADLGIDSIKRIEVLGALQQMGDELALSGTIDMEEVARLKTLRQIGEYLHSTAAAVVAPAAVGTARCEHPGLCRTDRTHHTGARGRGDTRCHPRRRLVSLRPLLRSAGIGVGRSARPAARGPADRQPGDDGRGRVAACARSARGRREVDAREQVDRGASRGRSGGAFDCRYACGRRG